MPAVVNAAVLTRMPSMALLPKTLFRTLTFDPPYRRAP